MEASGGKPVVAVAYSILAAPQVEQSQTGCVRVNVGSRTCLCNRHPKAVLQFSMRQKDLRQVSATRTSSGTCAAAQGSRATGAVPDRKGSLLVSIQATKKPSSLPSASVSIRTKARTRPPVLFAVLEARTVRRGLGEMTRSFHRLLGER